MSDENDSLDEQPEEVVDALRLTGVDALSGRTAVDALPVLAEVHTVAPASPATLPAVQAAAAAATGFLAGAATIALVRRHGARKLTRAQSRLPRDLPGAQPSRTYLVNVRLIGRSGE